MAPVFTLRRHARILIAPDSFKGTLSAAAAANLIADRLRRHQPTARIRLLPLADGGDGTLTALTDAGFDLTPIVTRGPLGVPAVSAVARLGGTAVVELASSCGIALLPPGAAAPLTSSTLGLGDAITAALDPAPTEVIIGLGGSASTDGGAGMLVALGARLLTRDGHVVAPDGAALVADDPSTRLDRIDLSGLDPRLRATRITAATDVRSPLLGAAGAARAFGPQKGATTQQVVDLERGLTRWARLLATATGIDAADVPGAGAAGGVGFAAVAALRAHVVDGATVVHEALGLAAHLAEADLVVTGEGCLDRTSLLGKGISHVVTAAHAAGVPVVAVCGRIDLTDEEVTAAGFAAATDLAHMASAFRGA